MQVFTKSHLEHVNNLFESKNYSELVEYVSEFYDYDDFVLKTRVYLLITKSYNYLNQFKMSCTYCNILLDELRPFLEINEIIDLMRFLGVNHGLMGNLEEGVKIFEELLEIVESLNDVENTSKVLLNLSLQYRRLGKKDESLSYGDRAIKILEMQGDEESIIRGKIYIIHTYLRFGLIKESRKIIEQIYERGKSVLEEPESSAMVSYLHGSIERIQGNYEEALLLFNNALDIWKETPNYNFSTDLLNEMSLIYCDLKQCDKAESALLQALRIPKEDQFINKSELIFNLIWVNTIHSTEGNARKISKYFYQLTNYYQITKSRIDESFLLLAESLILANSRKLEDFDGAKNILEKIIDSELYSSEITIKAISQLCRIYFIELKTLGEMEIITKLNYLLKRIDDYGIENHLLPIQLISKVLRAKLLFINNELSEAFNLYDQALTLATDLNILRMVDEIRNEQNIITQGMKVWNKLISEKSYVMEQINDEEINNYLSQISLFVSRFSSDNS